MGIHWTFIFHCLETRRSLDKCQDVQRPGLGSSSNHPTEAVERLDPFLSDSYFELESLFHSSLISAFPRLSSILSRLISLIVNTVAVDSQPPLSETLHTSRSWSHNTCYKHGVIPHHSTKKCATLSGVWPSSGSSFSIMRGRLVGRTNSPESCLQQVHTKFDRRGFLMQLHAALAARARNIDLHFPLFQTHFGNYFWTQKFKYLRMHCLFCCWMFLWCSSNIFVLNCSQSDRSCRAGWHWKLWAPKGARDRR